MVVTNKTLLVEKDRLDRELTVIKEFLEKAGSSYYPIALYKLEMLLFLQLITPEQYSEILGLP